MIEKKSLVSRYLEHQIRTQHHDNQYEQDLRALGLTVYPKRGQNDRDRQLLESASLLLQELRSKEQSNLSKVKIQQEQREQELSARPDPDRLLRLATSFLVRRESGSR